MSVDNTVVSLPIPERSVRKSRTTEALLLRRDAAEQLRYAATGSPDPIAALAEADRLDAQAAVLLKPAGAPTLSGGEVVAMPDDTGPVWEIANTLREPDSAAIEASIKRTELLCSKHTDLVALAMDTAASVKAGNSPEKMLAHQLAALHVLTMKAAHRALEFEKREDRYGGGFQQADAIEFGRLANAVGRLSGSFQEGMLTLQRLKTGGRQTVTVRHVTVEAGANAVIGNVSGGGKHVIKRRRGRIGK